MNTRLKNDILRHAEADYPRECCGLLVNVDGEVNYWPCANLAEGTDQFILSPEDYAAADAAGEIVAVVHSHPNMSPEPSQADKVSCEATGLPWHIVSWPGQEWAYLQPEGYQAPYIGRAWAHGVLDCYSLIRDWYFRERAIALPEFQRRDEWWHKGENLYLGNFAKAGFRIVPENDLQHGDVLLMQILAPVPNHGAIYLDGGIILHHLHGRLSGREVFGGYYRKNCVAVLRYGAEENHSGGGTGEEVRAEPPV